MCKILLHILEIDKYIPINWYMYFNTWILFKDLSFFNNEYKRILTVSIN